MYCTTLREKSKRVVEHVRSPWWKAFRASITLSIITTGRLSCNKCLKKRLVRCYLKPAWMLTRTIALQVRRLLSRTGRQHSQEIRLPGFCEGPLDGQTAQLTLRGLQRPCAVLGRHCGVPGKPFLNMTASSSLSSTDSHCFLGGYV